tara:strand:+ start:411 stop:1649 length:1239 start_codon:yes stop_codon:yes gene_type:complete
VTDETPTEEPYERNVLHEEENNFEEFSLTEDDYEIRSDVRWVRYRPSMGPIVRWGLVALVVIIVLLSGWTRLENWIDDQVEPDPTPGEEVEFSIEDGWTTNDVIATLGDLEIIDNPTMFRQWMRCPSVLKGFLNCSPGEDYSFQAGRYVLREHSSFQETVSELRKGPIPEEVIRVTVPEGLTLEQITKRLLETLPSFNEEELRVSLLDDRLKWEHYPSNLSFLLAEGLLFPDTYQLDEATVSDEMNLLLRMHRQFLKVIEEEQIEDKTKSLRITPYEAIIIASLIEEEAQLAEERPKIARVIYNRLERGWRLGIDATSRYAIGKTAGQELTTEDLEYDSPWNTRVSLGLPPTAISAPGRASIQAALNPAEGKWLYYVRTDENGVVGAHTFAITSEEFEKARKICVNKDLGCG